MFHLYRNLSTDSLWKSGDSFLYEKNNGFN